MIESGLYRFLTTNSAIAALLGGPVSVYFSVLPKQPALPAIRLFRVASPNAAETLDIPTAGSQTIAGRFQFDSFASDASTNPANPSGYLSAAMLSQAIRLQLLAEATLTLPDGTLLQDVRIHDEFDADYEAGGTSYVFRRVLDISLVYEQGAYAAYTPAFYEGFGPPTELENNDDIYFDESTGNVWEQVADVWTLVGNVPQGGSSEMPSLTYHKVAAAGTNAANIKAAGGFVAGWNIFNDTEFPLYVKLFNLATAPTPGASEPQQTIAVQAGQTAEAPAGSGLTYSTGIAIAITGNLADLDATAVSAGSCVVDIFYQ